MINRLFDIHGSSWINNQSNLFLNLTNEIEKESKKFLGLKSQYLELESKYAVELKRQQILKINKKNSNKSEYIDETTRDTISKINWDPSCIEKQNSETIFTKLDKFDKFFKNEKSDKPDKLSIYDESESNNFYSFFENSYAMIDYDEYLKQIKEKDIDKAVDKDKTKFDLKIEKNKNSEEKLDTNKSDTFLLSIKESKFENLMNYINVKVR